MLGLCPPSLLFLKPPQAAWVIHSLQMEKPRLTGVDAGTAWERVVEQDLAPGLLGFRVQIPHLDTPSPSPNWTLRGLGSRFLSPLRVWISPFIILGPQKPPLPKEYPTQVFGFSQEMK